MSLRANDLKDTISDLISIDEYKPKTGTDSEIIVVAFYAIDEAPAKDVDSFLERSYIDIVDVEVSPNPNEDGFYIIFIEMYRNDSFPEELLTLVKEMDRITGGMDWKISPYLADNTFDINDNTWKEYVIYDKDAYLSKTEFKKNKKLSVAKESVYDYFKNSHLKNIVMQNNLCELEGFRDKVVLEMIDLCNEHDMSNKHDFTNKTMVLENADRDVLSLRIMLGEGWDVIQYSDAVLLCNKWDDRLFYGKIC